MIKKNVVIGLLGTTLDGVTNKDRWSRWRPTVGLCQQEDLMVDRLELLYDPKYQKLADALGTDIKTISPETKVNTHIFECKDPWDFEQMYSALHDFAVGYPFNPDRENYLIHITTGTHVAQICLFLLTESRYLPGKLIQTSPAKREERGSSVGTYTIIDLDLSRYDRIATRRHQESKDAVSFLKSGIETKNKNFNLLISKMEKVGLASPDPLLLMGPTGAGKSRIARRIYELKKSRRLVGGHFVEVNCATLRGDAAMSALFGHVKGSFTGALQDRPGLLRKADGGMVFLDEIGELGSDEQAMLLHSLEYKTFFPLGSDKEVNSDFQLIAGTNRNLFQDVQDGKFREDLLARINLWTFNLPALKDRPEDIEPNIQHELEHYSLLRNCHLTFNKEAKDRFLKFATSSEAKWSANFRDLHSAISRMGTLAPGGRITLDIVEEEILRLKHDWEGLSQSPKTSKSSWVDKMLTANALATLDYFDRIQLEEVLSICHKARNLSDAGRILFTHSRKQKKISNDADRLRKYLARFDLSWERIKKD